MACILERLYVEDYLKLFVIMFEIYCEKNINDIFLSNFRKNKVQWSINSYITAIFFKIIFLKKLCEISIFKIK